MPEFSVCPLEVLGFVRLAVEVLQPRSGPWWVRFRDSVTGAEVVVSEAAREPRHYRRPDRQGRGPVFSALVRSHSEARSRQVLAADVKPVERGRGLARRLVYTVLGPSRLHPLRVGLTVHLSAYSSTPHTFEAAAVARAEHAGPEALPPAHRWEEVFFFRMPEAAAALVEGYGWSADGEWVDTATRVVNGAFVPIPLGYHRVAALPDHEGRPRPLAYWWAYLALDPAWEKLPAALEAAKEAEDAE